MDAEIKLVRGSQRFSLWLLVSLLGLIVFLLAATAQHRIPLWSCALPIPAEAAACYWYATRRDVWLRLLRRASYYSAGLDRMEDRWQGNGRSGDEFRVAGHVYDTDLQITGSGSLFELLCTARTGLGRRRLAEYLLRPCSLTEAQARQECVRELRPQTKLREQVALLGKYQFQESTWGVFSEWISRPAETAPGWVRTVAFLSSVLLALLLLSLFTTGIPKQSLLQWAPYLLIAELPIAWFYRDRTEPLNASARRVGVEVAVVREGIELIAALRLQSEKLVSIQSRLREGDAATALRKLEKLTGALAECDKPHFDLAAKALIVRTQLCFAIEEWKRCHGALLGSWLDAWAEFEALAAISGYAWEHPDDVFPVLEQGAARFQAEAVGHPLIPAATCVRNDIALGPERCFYVVSGSNMAGKSTLIRSVGLNAVLAQAGAPVRAASLRLTPLEVFASFSLADSVLEGKSKFFAEVERLRLTLEHARLAPVLFLIDEILSGTNSRDRRIASESIVRALVRAGAIGMLSTHDLALTEIAEAAGLNGCNVHMGSGSAEDALDFDYLLKPGVTTETNALAIVAMVGIPAA